jgi:hypothetical protein
MTAQPPDRIPASGPDTESYEVIHLGGQAAVVVPVSFPYGSPDRRRLRIGRYRVMYDITGGAGLGLEPTTGGL